MDKPFVFKDPQKLYEMAVLRRSGWSVSNLSEIYKCDRSSLRFQFRKYTIIPIPEVQFEMKRVVKNALKELPTVQESQPKMYKDYLPKGFNLKFYSRYL